MPTSSNEKKTDRKGHINSHTLVHGIKQVMLAGGSGRTRKQGGAYVCVCARARARVRACACACVSVCERDAREESERTWNQVRS